MNNMKRRHSGHMGGGMNNGRRGGGGGKHHGNHGGFQKPRKNYPALREKYLNMARDAMSSGDRVLAEYYLQHAEHYFRMQQEFMAERAARYQQSAQNNEPMEEMSEESSDDSVDEEVNIPNNSNVLPAFLTRQVPAASAPKEDEKMLAASGWEEE